MDADRQAPPWPAPRAGQERHDEPDGSVWQWTGERWALVATDGGRGEDARLWARAAEVAGSFQPGEPFTLGDLPGEAPGPTRPTDQPGAHRSYQVWWNGAGWWAQDGRWHQVDPPGSFSDVIALHRRLDALDDALQPANLRGVPNELVVARLLELAGDDDRILRIELRALGDDVLTDHARRLLVAALSDAPVRPPAPEVAERLRRLKDGPVP